MPRLPHRTVIASTVTVLVMVGVVHAKAGAHPVSLAEDTARSGTMTATGPAIAITHGIVQVVVSFSGDRITNVTALQLPHDNDTSWQVSNRAAAILRSEVISAQCAEVDAVSGATYTSGAYLESLQAAIDSAPALDALASRAAPVV
jgi:uncharacterized protein with FMN-binding domain